MEPTITRMYPSGPYRLFSETRFLGAVPYKDAVREGFAGPYVCAVCQQQVREVVVAAGEWVCGGCVTSGQRKRDNRGSMLRATRTQR
jgi:hypothetical protein